MSQKKTVMVVDDDETIRDLVEWALHDAGYEVISAPDGSVALDLLGSTRPDLILLDLRMPVMDGWAFARSYRGLPEPHAPIVVITAALDGRVLPPEIGAAGLMAKPFDLDELLANVARHTTRG